MQFFLIASLLISRGANADGIATAKLLPPIACQGGKAAGTIEATLTVPIPKPTRDVPLDMAQTGKANYLRAVNDFIKGGGFFSVASNPRRSPKDGPYALLKSTFDSEMNDQAHRYNFYVHMTTARAAIRHDRFEIVRVGDETYLLPFVLGHLYNEKFEYSDFLSFVDDSVPSSDGQPSSLLRHADDLWVKYFETHQKIDSSPNGDGSAIVYHLSLKLDDFCKNGRKKIDLNSQE